MCVVVLWCKVNVFFLNLSSFFDFFCLCCFLGGEGVVGTFVGCGVLSICRRSVLGSLNVWLSIRMFYFHVMAYVVFLRMDVGYNSNY